MLEFKEFLTDEEAKLWLSDNYNLFITNIQSSIGAKERDFADIIYEYGGSMYKAYNSILKDIDGRIKIGQSMTRNQEYVELFNDIMILKENMSKNIIKENIVVYRYVKLKPFDLFKLLFKKNGHTIIERRFMSTTLMPFCEGIKNLRKREKYNVLFKIRVQKGTPSIPLSFTKEQSPLQEFEMLFLPDMQLTMEKRYFSNKVKMLLFEFSLR